LFLEAQGCTLEAAMKKSLWVVAVLLLAAVVLSAQTVYITKTGAKYHTSICRYLSKSKIAIDLADAIARGYTACSVCRPPSKVEGKAQTSTIRPLVSSPSTVQDLYRVDHYNLTKSTEVDLLALLPAKVVRTVDGDTLTIEVSISRPAKGLEIRETVRLLGVDTPETVDPRKPVEPFAKEASGFTRVNLVGKMVMLAFDWDLRDKYNRILAYIYLTDGRCWNLELLSRGYARAYLDDPFQFSDEFREQERLAREAGIGLWAD
jgi:micrococcal nuclease